MLGVPVSRKIDPAWANRRRMLTAKERLSHKAFATMWSSLIDSDPTGQILTAWIAKEELRALLSLARTGARRDQIRERLFTFYGLVRRRRHRRDQHPRGHGRDLVAGDRGVHRLGRDERAPRASTGSSSR
jgi:hypothetical protein